MKTRLRDLLKNNKLLNIVSNRYNLDKEDRKTLNEMISNQGSGTDDGMEYYLVLDRSILRSIITGDVYNSSYFFVTVLTEGRTNSIETREYTDLSHLDDCVAFCTSKICKFDTRDTLTCKENLQSIVDLNNQSYFKRITAKEYYSLSH